MSRVLRGFESVSWQTVFIVFPSTMNVDDTLRVSTSMAAIGSPSVGLRSRRSDSRSSDRSQSIAKTIWLSSASVAVTLIIVPIGRITMLFVCPWALIDTAATVASSVPKCIFVAWSVVVVSRVHLDRTVCP